MLRVDAIDTRGALSRALRAGQASPAIVLGGQVSGLAVARALGRREIPVVVLDPDPRAIALTSRYVTAGGTIRNPLEDEPAFLAQLVELGHGLEQPGVLYATGDEWALAAARHADALGSLFRPLPSDPGVVGRILDKASLYSCAEALGIPVPTYAVLDWAATEHARERVGYPCVVKPTQKRDFVRRFGQAALVAATAAELDATLDVVGDREVLLQELLPLEDAVLHTAAIYLDSHGRRLASFGGRRLAVHPAGFGTSCLVESVPEAGLSERAFTLLESLSYRGIAEVEFIWDPRRLEWMLIDVNPRCWKWVGLPGFAGVDLPWLAYQDALGEVASAPPQTPGLRWASLLDLAALNAPAGNGGLLSEREWAGLLAGDEGVPVVDAVFARDDPLPFVTALEGLLGGRGATCRC